MLSANCRVLLESRAPRKAEHDVNNDKPNNVHAVTENNIVRGKISQNQLRWEIFE